MRTAHFTRFGRVGGLCVGVMGGNSALGLLRAAMRLLGLGHGSSAILASQPPLPNFEWDAN